MMEQLTYPNRAGYKANGASKIAADKIEKSGRRITVAEKVLQHVAEAGETGLTGGELWQVMGGVESTVKARLTELYKQGKVWKCETLRYNPKRDSSEHVYKLPKYCKEEIEKCMQ